MAKTHVQDKCPPWNKNNPDLKSAVGNTRIVCQEVVSKSTKEHRTNRQSPNNSVQMNTKRYILVIYHKHTPIQMAGNKEEDEKQVVSAKFTTPTSKIRTWNISDIRN